MQYLIRPFHRTVDGYRLFLVCIAPDRWIHINCSAPSDYYINTQESNGNVRKFIIVFCFNENISCNINPFVIS